MTTHIGIDVAAKKLAVAALRDSEVLWEGEFANDPKGHKALLKRLRKLPKGDVRVVVEATSIYSLDLSLALHNGPERIKCMVANPRQVSHFAKATAQRGKTDPMDAVMLARFAMAMPFVDWQPPEAAMLECRQFVRRIEQLVRAQAKEKTRLKGLLATSTTEKHILEDVEAHITYLAERIQTLEKAAVELAFRDDALARRFKLLCSIPGVAKRSALRILAELAVLPSDMDAKQVVAHAGLDPRPWTSGDMKRPARISKQGNAYLRKALFLPAMTAVTHSPHVKAFADKLVGRGKTKKQAIVAVMRKMLHAIWGMFKHDSMWDGKKFAYDQKVRHAA